MNLTLFKRVDINIDWCFSVVSVGFTAHKRGFHISLVFLDISFYYFSPQRRAEIEERYKVVSQAMEEDWYEG
jgi:hypothetical protein